MPTKKRQACLQVLKWAFESFCKKQSNIVTSVSIRIIGDNPVGKFKSNKYIFEKTSSLLASFEVGI